MLAVAAGVVFYGLLAVFPAVTALVSLYGLSQVLPRSAINAHFSLEFCRRAVDILRKQIDRLTAGSGAKLGFGFLFGLAVALGANAGMKAIMDALNVVYEEKEKRGFIRLNLMSLAFTISATVAAISSWRRRGGSGRAQLSRASKCERIAASPWPLAPLVAGRTFWSCSTVLLH